MNFQERFNQLIEMDKTHEKDLERKSMFYIFAKNHELFNKINHLYDFNEHCIRPESLEGELPLSIGEKSLVGLAYSHYNGFAADINGTFYTLDDNNFMIAIDSIKMRYRK